MHWATFMDMVAQVVLNIMCQDISMWSPLTPRKKVAITIMKLTTPPSSCCCVTNLFSTGKSRARDAVREEWLTRMFWMIRHFIRLMNLQQVVAGFCHMGVPNCVVAMDGTHIPICFPTRGTWVFINC
ncbi:hypothetical protein Y1Q_0015936 [Alligator mississippiensis]|uniref:DDE Tnp4 domain-containing protein n=1 Tax=Alligator mississippiensis TaxID=8496 RepID=A0A151MUV6_ALLMI|nr:hypothetical protein Y1Q_0015936 [Alligator mississippiensis]